MSTTPTANPSEHNAQVHQWLHECEHKGMHPEHVRNVAEQNGYSPAHARYLATGYSKRFPQGNLGWPTLFIAVGMFAMSIAGVGHVVISRAAHGQAGLQGPTGEGFFAMALVALPFAVLAVKWAKKEQDTVHAAWANQRRVWSTLLFGFVIATAVIRGLIYGGDLGSHVVGDGREICGAVEHQKQDRWNDRIDGDYQRNYSFSSRHCEPQPIWEPIAQLGLTAVIAGPVGWWVWYGHRSKTDSPSFNLDPAAAYGPDPDPGSLWPPAGTSDREGDDDTGEDAT